MTSNERQGSVGPANGSESLAEHVQQAAAGTLQQKHDGVDARVSGQRDTEVTMEPVPESATMTSRLTSVIQAIARATSIAEMVRLGGASLIVFAMSLFLMQGVEVTNDLQRFHWLLLQTALLGGAGFAVGYLLKENRGARIFFSLGLISIPANLAVLGGMIYSIMPAGSLSPQYPDYANWQASNFTEIAIALGTGTLVLVPMALFAFSVFARQSRLWLTGGYLFASSMLLIPIRSTWVVTFMAGLVAMGLLVLIRQRRSTVISVLTAEEKFAHLLLFLPPILMVARSAMLYSSEFNMLASLSIVAYLVLRFCSQRCQQSLWWNNIVPAFTALAAIYLSVLLSSLIALNGFFTGANLIFSLILGGLLLDLSRVVSSRRLRWWMHAAWAFLCIPAFFGNYVLWSGATSIVIMLAICLLMVVSGVVLMNRLVTVLGVLSLVGNLLVQGSYMSHMLMASNWMTLALMGGVIVVIGSLIDSYGVTARLKIQAWMKMAAKPEPAVSAESFVEKIVTEELPDDDKRSKLAA